MSWTMPRMVDILSNSMLPAVPIAIDKDSHQSVPIRFFMFSLPFLLAVIKLFQYFTPWYFE